ncbi:50S ribosomal protein L18 [Breznakiellaceae bacterium SP9]
MQRNMLEKNRKRLKRKIHIRKRIMGTSERPRMTITKSNKRLYIQVIDDFVGNTLVSASTLETDLRNIKNNIAGAVQLGEIIGKRLVEHGIQNIVFDRNGYLYHGVVKALADSVRKTGITF